MFTLSVPCNAGLIDQCVRNISTDEYTCYLFRLDRCLINFNNARWIEDFLNEPWIIISIEVLLEVDVTNHPWLNLSELRLHYQLIFFLLLGACWTFELLLEIRHHFDTRLDGCDVRFKEQLWAMLGLRTL